MSVTPALGRLRQEDFTFKDIYSETLCGTNKQKVLAENSGHILWKI
jgi:hypothetical protein